MAAFNDIRVVETVYKEKVKQELELKDRQLAVVSSLAAMASSPGWRNFKEKLELLRAASVRDLVSEQDPNQKFRVSGRVEAFAMLLAVIDDAASEADRIENERKELAEWASKQLSEDLRLHPAGGIWKDGKAHGGSRGRQGEGG